MERKKKAMELEERYHGDIEKLYERLNDSLSAENDFLREQIREKDRVIKLLYEKQGITEKIITDVSKFKPIGGYISLAEQIKQAELEEREEIKKNVLSERELETLNAV